MNTKRKKLTEKELGSLYLLSETPLITDKILKVGQCTDSDVTELHKSLSKHAPDMAMIGIALSGNILSEAMKKIQDDEIQTLATELKYLSVNTLEEVGRIWIDACRYGVATDQDIDDITHQASDILCMFSSLFMEIAEAATPEPELIRALAATLMYQCEGQADAAQYLVDQHIQAQQPEKTTAPANIPLPPELQNKTYEDNVVMFSLFSENKPAH